MNTIITHILQKRKLRHAKEVSCPGLCNSEWEKQDLSHGGKSGSML